LPIGSEDIKDYLGDKQFKFFWNHVCTAFSQNQVRWHTTPFIRTPHI